MAKKQSENNDALPPAVILVDLSRADWRPIDPERRTDEVKKFIAYLERRVRGQPRAIEAVADAYELMLSGYRDPRRPIVCLAFLGPSGVGKTEIVRALCAYLLGRDDAMTRIDCSEYQERHQISRLIGAPPGYIRSDETPILAQERIDRPGWEARSVPHLAAMSAIEEEFQKRREERSAIRAEMDLYEKRQRTRTEAYHVLSERLAEIDRDLERLRKEFDREDREAAFRPGERSYTSIVLFDEIEKAHPDLHNLLLQIMDEGGLTISRPQGKQHPEGGSGAAVGERTSFADSFVFMTSNVGREEIEKLLRGRGHSIGFVASRSLPRDDPEAFSDEIYNVAMREFRTLFRAEFRGRVDRVIVFRPLFDDALRQILDDVIETETEALRDRYGVVCIVADAVKELLLAETKQHSEEGARLLRRNVQRFVVDPIRRAVVSGQVVAHDVVAVALECIGEKEEATYQYDARTRRRIATMRRRGATIVEIRIAPERDEDHGDIPDDVE